jgi:hypothetical protein
MLSNVNGTLHSKYFTFLSYIGILALFQERYICPINIISA